MWTSKRSREVLARHFGVTYHPDQVRQLLREMGLSYPQPFERAMPRDEEEIVALVRTRWPEIKKLKRRSAPSSSLMKWVSIYCRWPLPRGHLSDRPQCCVCRSRVTICRLSVG